MHNQDGRQATGMQLEQDVTERQQAEQILRAHEAGLRRSPEMGKLAHVITGPGGELLAWSETLPAMMGRDTAAMPATMRGWLKLVHPEDRERFRLTIIEAAQSGGRAELEYRLQHGAGAWIHIRAVMERLDPPPGPGAGGRWLSTLQDTTGAKRTERARRLSAEYYRATFEQAAAGIVRSSLRGKVQLVNQAFCAMSGYSRDEARHLNIRDITHPDDINPGIQSRAKLLAHSGVPFQSELRLRRKDGSYLWVNVATSLVRAADGSSRHFVSVLSDISDRKRTEEEVQRLRAAMDATVDAIFLTDPHTLRFLYVNDSACRRLGYTREQLLQKAPFEVLSKTREELRREYDEIIAAGERGMSAETRYVRRDGGRAWSELYRRALSTDGGMVIVTTARDITERKAQQEKIERLNRVYAMLSGINAAIMRIRDRDELFRESCRIAHEAGGFDAVSIRLIDQQSLIADVVAWRGDEETVRWLREVRFSLRDEEEHGSSLLAEMMRTQRPVISNDAQTDPSVPFKEAMGKLEVNSVVFLPLTVADKVVGVMAMYSPRRDYFDAAEVKLLSELAADISYALEQLEKSERAAYLALYDELTGLANRRLHAERLGQFLRLAGRARSKLALALLDLERTRAVNKSLGRRAGDALLRSVSERLVKAAGVGTVARISSTHFAVVLPTLKDRSEAERMMAALTRSCFGEPYVIEGTELQVRVKVGVALFPNDGLDTETLLINAEAALRKAKATGERQVFYTPDLIERTGASLPLESNLVRALDKDEFVLHYQPKVETTSRSIVGLEALIRWQSPEFGLVPPGKFIAFMEETGMILEVGAWALRRAALDHRKWVELGLKPGRVAVNVSGIQLRQRDFVQAVEQAIREGVSPTAIDLELTESIVMEDVEENIRKLNELRALGLQVAIDDFGTGYSSLGYLAKLPVQALKIDRSFVIAMAKDPAAMTLVQTIISLAHALGLKVVAEGVEEEQQAEHLRLLRCDQIQGFLVSKAVPFDETARLLRQTNS